MKWQKLTIIGGASRTAQKNQLVESLAHTVKGNKIEVKHLLMEPLEHQRKPRVAGLNRPVLECNDQGVEFVVAFANASFHDWSDSMKHCSIEHELNPAQTEITDHKNFPQLKVTKFRCGRIALGLVTTHIVTNGSSIFAFFKAWSDIHQGLPPPNPMPSFDSSILRARDPPSIKMPIRDYVAVPPSLAQDHTGKDISPKYHNRAFHMSELQLSHLRHEITSGPFSYGSFPRPWQPSSGNPSVRRGISSTPPSPHSSTRALPRPARTGGIPDELCGTSAMTRVRRATSRTSTSPWPLASSTTTSGPSPTSDSIPPLTGWSWKESAAPGDRGQHEGRDGGLLR
ncbi:hypothetical protein SELMODRAFT_408128 [Selaginella moellendorffii]|uniref:BAHD family acyltransferase, clade V n=1 Tax=Selaginella moellendorffii TaxID=88036 RepID=D8R7A1_SELML|nr:hypothetical protein SELMODRAFT_408128 [Selaginella moellendorffii]